MLSAEDFEPEEEENINPLAEEGFELMGAAFEVHRVIRGGLLEDIYQESFEEELRLRAIPFTAKQDLAVFYKGGNCASAMHVAQLLNYMRLARKPVGYLINFGPLGKVEWRRFVLKEFVQPWMLLKKEDRP